MAEGHESKGSGFESHPLRHYYLRSCQYACDKSNIKALVIKGIMDTSSSGRDEMKPALKKKWMEYAARAAAEFAIDVVRQT